MRGNVPELLQPFKRRRDEECLHNDEQDGSAMAEMCDGCLIHHLLAVHVLGGHWNGEGDAGHEEHGTACLVGQEVELLLLVLAATTQETKACAAHPGLSNPGHGKSGSACLLRRSIELPLAEDTERKGPHHQRKLRCARDDMDPRN